MTRFITTLGYAGLSPVAPGTVGSAVAVPLGVLLYLPTGWIGFALGLLAVTLVGIWAIGVETRDAPDPDLSEIVIDECAGQWIALVPVFAVGAETSWILLGLSFVLFRVFDIAKPPPISWIDRMKSPIGVMGDDLVAGLAAAATLAAILTFAPGIA